MMAELFLKCIWALIVLASPGFADSEAIVNHSHTYRDYYDDPNNETRLLKQLFSVGDTHSRPVKNFSESIRVNWTTHLFEIIEVDKKCFVTADIFIGLTWTNAFLTWNPDDFGGINLIHASIYKMWNPKFNILLSGGQLSLIDDRVATISSSGLVTWTPHLRLRVLGPTDFTYFPYDEHRFHFLISSWLPDSMLNFFLANDYESWKLMNPGTEWDLVSAQSRLRDFENSKETYSGISYIVKVMRRSTFYSYIIVWPIFVIGVLIVLMLLLPHKQRFIAGSLFILCLLVISSMVQDALPSGLVRTPIIALILVYEFACIFIVFLFSILTSHLREKDPRASSVPSSIKKIFMNKYMNCFFCVLGNNKTVFPKALNLGMSYSQLYEEENHASSISSGPAQDQHIPENSNKHANGATDSISFKKAHHGLEGAKSEGEANEWMQLADILDRSFCILLSIASAISVAKICHPSSISTF